MALGLKKNAKQTLAQIAPLVTVRETDKEVILEAEMAGLDKDSIKIELKGDELTIGGVRKNEDVPKGYTPLSRERCPFEYSRTFVLGNEVDKEKLSAQYNDGVLKITVPKSESNQPKKIPIKD
ncbi:MAG: Hsp20/alpha crystallin family protein [Candidatus Omnitrophica bacterium]|nr:Hsp20/alpha crystallin family protein [Candidatus Omnitrophota bacterium]MCM8791449.1 Hsp20/alpha crystallin family protein [Candidatus Omnitrophota bacterium]